MEYVAIDFQTANELRASACSVALVTVKDGEVVDVFYSLIRPDVLRFNKDNVAMHGITEAMVKDKPYFVDLWPLIKEKIKGKMLVAHYAAFDMDVLADTLEAAELPFPNNQVLCTCVLGRALFPALPHHHLEDVCAAVGYDYKVKYNALENAKACVAIVEYAIKASSVPSIQELALHYDMSLGYIGNGMTSSCSLNKKASAESAAPMEVEVPTNDFPTGEYLKLLAPAYVLILTDKALGKPLGGIIGIVGTGLMFYATYKRFSGTKRPWLYGFFNIMLGGLLGFSSVGRKK